MSIRIRENIHSERAIGNIDGARQIAFDFSGGSVDAAVPAILQLPASAERVPGALLLHGYTSHKEQMANTLGRALVRCGIASLSIDLPMHGERRGSMQAQALNNPLALASTWRLAQREAKLAIGYLSAHSAIDNTRIAVVGYSMGSFLGVQVAASESRVRALVLAAGGDLPENTPFERLVRTIADPLRAIRKLDGRALLMVHGRNDRTVTPAQAQRLFDAAREPKTIRWWPSGHYLPDVAIADAAEWLHATLAKS